VSSSAARSTSSIDLSKRDLTLDLARVVCVLLVVAIHLLLVGVGFDERGELVALAPTESPVGSASWFAPATWAGQIMPLFFVVGGFASITAWRSLTRRGGDAADYVRSRVLRLAQPALPLYVFTAVVIGGAMLLGLPAALVTLAVEGAASPLWFLAAYTLCQALVPLMVRLHTTAPRATLAGLLAGAVVVDAVRFTSGVEQVGLLNLVFVWLLVQQLGFWYADGWFDRRRWWQLALLAVAGYTVLVPMTAAGPYPVDMLTNLNPPTLPLVALAIAQTSILRLLRPALARLMSTHAARAAVFLVGSRLMTVYLWHLPVILVVTGVSLVIPGAAPEPGSAAWWWSRPLLFVVVLVAVFGMSALVGRWESPKQVGATPPGAVVGVAALLSFIPSFLVMEFFMDLPIAVIGSVLLAIAVLALGRWPSRARNGAETPAT
jgi:fucose 4-O-acetylase-like acetyltransferase